MNDYQKITQTIHAPAHLQGKVLERCDARTRKVPRKALLRAAVCTACAIALVLGGLRPTAGEAPAAPHYELGITTFAADLTANATLYFPVEDGAVRFRSSAETLTASRGELRREGDVYTLSPAAGESVESLDGTALTLSAGEESATFLLTAENLRAFRNEDGTEVLSPLLAGDSGGTLALVAATEESRFLRWPVAGSNTVSLSHAYGSRETPTGTVFHAGIDIPGERGTPITAAEGGTVTKTGWDDTLGNYLMVEHEGGLVTLYGQCQEILAAQGQTVAAGDTIALLGSTGMSTGPHLHFEVRQNGENQNPAAYFSSAVRAALCAR